MMNWINNVEIINQVLRSLSVTDDIGEDVDHDNAYTEWKKRVVNARNNRKTVFLIGNGASASMASHVAADLAKNAHVRTEVFYDLSLLTAIANDISYTEIFAEPIRRRMVEGDILVAVSSSGQSPNILRAVEEAKTIGGFVVTLSAMKPDNVLRFLGDFNFYVPATTYGGAETCHAAILHHWMDLMVEAAEEDMIVNDKDSTKHEKEEVAKWKF